MALGCGERSFFDLILADTLLSDHCPLRPKR